MDPSSREYIYPIYFLYIFYIYSIYVFSAGGRVSIYSMKWSLFLPSLVDIGLLKPPAENVERNQSSFLTPQHVNSTFSLNATVSRGQWYSQVPRPSCELGNLTTNETTFNSCITSVFSLWVNLYNWPPTVYIRVLFVHLLFIQEFCFPGFGFGLIYLPAIVSVSMYFEKKRAFATGIAVCGSGLGTFIMAPVTEGWVLLPRK